MWSAIAILLLAPAVAMRFTREVDWTMRDFLAAALLLVTAGLVYQFAVRRVPRRMWRLLGSGLLLTALLAIWAEGAIGIL
jgi:NhaP-type Na+/H+ or K+/H+ antiporter